MTLRGIGWAWGLVMTLLAQSAAAAGMLDLDLPAGPLLSCLERVALAAHVRIVDHSGQAAQAHCTALKGHLDFDDAMNRLLPSTQWQWRRLDAGTVEVSAAAPKRLDLDPLDIEGAPVPGADVERTRGPAPTLLADQATATTSLDRTWLDTAPLVSFAQIGRYAPNVYASGSGLAIRGVVRNNQYSTASAFYLDGIDLGALLLDNDLVPLEGLQQIDVVRGPRAFEAGVKSAAGGVRLYTPAPAPEGEGKVTAGIGSREGWLANSSWSGPLGDTGAGASVMLQRRTLPDDLEQVRAPRADVQKRRNDAGRAKLSFQPAALPGLSAEVSLLAANGDSSDRFITVPASQSPAQIVRKNYDRNVMIGETHGRGAAASLSYDFDNASSLHAYASALAAERDTTLQPANNSSVLQHENNAHAGLVYTVHPADDWTLVTGVDRSRNDTREDYDAQPTGPPKQVVRALRSDSAWVWLEHSWSETWNAGLGLRWVREKIAADFEGPSTTPSAPTPTQAAVTDSLPIPMATLKWIPSATQNLVLGYSWGFRSSGAVRQAAVFDADRERDTELSWNAQWLDARVSTRATLFREDFYAVATTSLGGYNQLRSRQSGMEVEINAELFQDCRLRAGAGWLNGRDSASVLLSEENAGRHLAEAPTHTAVLGVRYGSDVGLYASADAYYSSSVYDTSYLLAIENRFLHRYPPFSLVDLRLGYRWRHWQGALTVSNAQDSVFFEKVSPPSLQAFPANARVFQLGDPRRVELRFSRSW
jgi:hypothetical protein